MLDPTKDQLLDGVKAGRAQAYIVSLTATATSSLSNTSISREHLDELALAAIADRGFQKPPEMFELFGRQPCNGRA